MRTRFRAALIHEPAGMDSAVALNRIQRPLRIREATETPARIECPRTETSTSLPGHAHLEATDLWRFAADWRQKPVDNFIPVPERKKIFRCLATGVASIALLLVAGCKTDSSPQAHGAEFSSVTNVQPPGSVSAQMLTMTNQLDPMLLRAPTNLFTLGPGDKLDIELVDETNSLSATVVGPDGKIYFNLLPGLDVWGLTLGQTRQLIERGLTKYVRGQPEVNVTLRSVGSKRIWLLGRFQAPGVYALSGTSTLLAAIAAAGGSQSFAGQRQISEGGPLGADLADLQHSFIVRDNKMLPVDFHALLEQGDMSQNIYLQADDFIYFAPAYAKEVYVLGAVTQPRPVQYVEGMTLMQAIAGSYGTVRDAWLGHVTIVRGSIANPQVAFVNYYDIVKGKTPDVSLQPNDIVYVPLTRYRYLRKYLDVALNTFVSSVAINEGTKISTPRSQNTPGVIIPVGSGITIIPPPAPPIH